MGGEITGADATPEILSDKRHPVPRLLRSHAPACRLQGAATRGIRLLGAIHHYAHRVPGRCPHVLRHPVQLDDPGGEHQPLATWSSYQGMETTAHQGERVLNA